MPSHNIAKQFYEESLTLLEQFVSLPTEQEAVSEYKSQIKHLYELMEKIPGRTDNVSFGDLEEVYIWARLIGKARLIEKAGLIGKEGIFKDPKRNEEMTRRQIENLKRQLHKIVTGEKEVFNFYFPVGQLLNFNSGFQIGSGNLCAFNELSKTEQRGITLISNRHQEFNIRIKSEIRSDVESRYEDYTKHWYLQINMISIGREKAKEKSIALAKRYLSIMKTFYSSERVGFHRPGDIKSTLTFFYQSEKEHFPSFIPAMDSTTNFERNPKFDTVISEINQTLKKLEGKEISDIEGRIINAIDLHGLSDSNTPYHIRFVLCIMALECLVLHESDKDYLGWKLAEKICFLLGGRINLKDPLRIISYLSEKSGNAVIKSRELLFYQIKDLYNKRSRFAHTGLRNEKNFHISPEDYSVALTILQSTIQRLFELEKIGITHVQKKGKETFDQKSLDSFIENLKFS